MAIILHINTAHEKASVCVAEEEIITGFSENDHPKDHSSWLHTAIKELFAGIGKRLGELDAIAVTIGPGSYTGLRVGLSAAKGLCFSLNKPLIGINTLELIAESVDRSEVSFVCPMIDARRMEVFTAIYSPGMEAVLPPHARILEKDSFAGYLDAGPVLFAGNGVPKFRALVSNRHAIFKEHMPTAKEMTGMAIRSYRQKEFSDLAYTAPLYLKEFYQGGT